MKAITTIVKTFANATQVGLAIILVIKVHFYHLGIVMCIEAFEKLAVKRMTWRYFLALLVLSRIIVKKPDPDCKTENCCCKVSPFDIVDCT
jgi:hypothetical protein